ncbi:GAF domain-containing protein [Rhodocytophaga aerolata]|uniref:GAF domain-containing protein n=1 Tax=Rhodocytophaga aerolata TaxID=455078 RepID=A0ABT8R0K5_9BACT|nr:GAF domain-containing protein [Rhodocytophaga aerolata]MDO1445627.1 GAF domain-containing protein [Rhodocytophaga aerolata]
MQVVNLSLVTKLRVAFLAVPFLLILTITIYSGLNLAANENQLKAATAIQVSRSVMEKVDRNFYERFGDVQAYAANQLAIEMASTDSVSPQSQKFINTMTAYYVLYDLMLVVNREGKVIAANTQDKAGNSLATDVLLGKDFSTEAWYVACMSAEGPKGGAWYSDFQVNPHVAAIHRSNGWGMAFAAPIKNDSGQTVGVWYNFASWKEVTQGIRQEALQALQASEAGSEILLVNQQGKIIDASDERVVLNQSLVLDSLSHQLATTALLPDFLQGKEYASGTFASTGAYTYAGKHWQCVTVIPKASLSLAYFFTKELLFIDITFLLIAWFASKLISGNIVSRVYQLRDIISKLSKGDIRNVDLAMTGNDELTQMATAVSSLADGLKRTSAFADEVGKGNFNAVFTPLSEADTLGNALLKMNNNLKIAAEEDRKRSWASEGQAKFAEILRSTTDLSLLAEKIMSGLVKYLQANQGGLFIVQEKDGQLPELELLACYAYNRKKFVEKTIPIGEGLLGQAYLEKDTLLLTEIPAGYLQITSGLGEANPTCLLIVPLKVQDKVEGVLELASFNKFEAYEIAFVEKLAESIASTIAAVKTTARTQKLLQESQQQAEELRSQEEEMRQNMEELVATQEEMKRKEAEYASLLTPDVSTHLFA